MPQNPINYHWSLNLDGTPEDLWPMVSNTDRFDRDTGTPKINYSENIQTNGMPLLVADFTIYGFHFEYTQEPFEWEYPYKFGVKRNYNQGIIKELAVLVNLTKIGPDQTKLDYLVQVLPKSWLGRLSIPFQIGWISRKNFMRTFQHYAARIKQSTQWQNSDDPPTKISSGGKAALTQLVNQLISVGFNEDLVTQFSDFLLKGDELLVGRIRPYEIAGWLKIDPRQCLEICLHATRMGALELNWELLCPLCRVSKEKSTSLEKISPQVHCSSCNIDFTANFENAVEVTFRIQETIRDVQNTSYCIGGPQYTPHIIMQCVLESNATLDKNLTLEPGRYRIRSLQKSGGMFIKVGEKGTTRLNLNFCDPWPEEEIITANKLDLHIENNDHDRNLIILERQIWSDLAVTASELFTIQTFRDLFSREILHPDYQITVGSIAILFTDLCGSTALYQQIGDASAFGKVLAHFEVLKNIINTHQGAVIKTIGDAVMAVFKKPEQAVKAMQTICTAMKNNFGPDLAIKGSLHFGPAIAVNLNDRLDYFGSTINLASRLEKFAEGNDIIVSDEVFTNPNVQELIKSTPLIVVSKQASLKGFSNDVPIHRITFIR